MQATDLLQTFAEIGIGLVGFTGIVAALQTRREGASSQSRPEFLFLIIWSVATVLFALLPLVLILVVSEALSWRIASAVLLAAFLAVFVPYWLPGSRLRPAYAEQGPVGWWTQLVLTTFIVLTILGLGLAVAGFFAGQAAFIYAAGLVYTLVNGLTNFVQLLTGTISRVHEDSQ